MSIITNPLKIFIDPGHGDWDSGASFHGLKEKDIVLDICLATQELLQYFHWTALSRNRDEFIALQQRADLANSWKADIFISVHCNADADPDEPGDPEATGEEIWIYRGSQESKRLALALREHVDKMFPAHRFRGIREGRKWVTRKSTMPAVLVEVGFIDSLEGHGALNSELMRKKIGRLLFDGIREYANIREQDKALST